MTDQESKQRGQDADDAGEPRLVTETLRDLDMTDDAGKAVKGGKPIDTGNDSECKCSCPEYTKTSLC